MDKKLQYKNDLEFLTKVGIMVILNTMLMFWHPFIQVPLVLILLVLDIIQKLAIKKYVEKTTTE